MAGTTRKFTLTSWIGLALIAANLVIFLAGPLLAPYGLEETLGTPFAAPSAEHPLGLDQNGRDMLSRMLYGAQLSIGVSLLAVGLSFSIGVPLGVLAAIRGGVTDIAMSRTVDAIMSVPVLISALVVLQALGSSLPVLIITIGLLDSTRVFRLARILAQGINAMEYAEVARLRGEGLVWMIRKEILPNAMPPLVAEFGLRFCFTFLFVAGLSYLGLGVQPPFADWGGMVRDNQQGILYGLYAPLFPAAAIALLTIGVNLVVDWLLAGRTTVQGENR
ncbi:ABC transporter permease [Tabrizicola soli]|uniref:ABC transporter permease n=1 Tax=Tabrizicola soli TaxID=2185115 RepID=A0ABV7DWM7_9RHOB|nr:ABC transporter permease [Tabrizicola soli]